MPLAASSLLYTLNLVLLSFSLLLFGTHYAVANSMPDDVSQEQVDKLKKRIKSLDSWLNRANSEKSGLAKELKKQEKEIDRISKRIRETQKTIANNEKNIKKLRQQQKKQTKALDLQKQSLVKQLQSAYTQSNQSALKLLLDTDDPQQVARIMSYYKYINDASTEQMDTFKATVAKLQSTKNAILKEQSQLQKSKSALEENHKSLINSRNKRRQVLAKLNSSIKTESANLQRLKDDYVRLDGLLKEVELAIANLKLPSDAKPFRQRKAKLPWPTRGKVVSKFGSRIAKGKLKSNGIVIKTKADSPIISVHYGRVVFSDWIRGFGLMLIVDHGDGFMSLYGHNSSLAKETGDWVGAGEIIAYSGEYEASGKTGLYFEIRKDGKPQNPRKWLQK